MLGNQDYLDLCEKFVEQVQGSAQKFASAATAWDNQKNKVSGLDGVQPGDAIYFAPDQSNSHYGHAAVYTGNNNMISAANKGVEQDNIDSWVKNTGQKLLGYIPKV